MPEGWLEVVGLLALGYLLLVLELFVPGGILGGLAALVMLYASYLAFGIGPGWGIGSVLLSVAVTAVGARIFIRSRMARRFVLADRDTAAWKASDEGLGTLLGKEGRTLTPLRPAGLVEIDERRIDVVSDSELIGAGVRVRVVEVEGNRVVVEPVEESPAEEAEETEPATVEGSP